MTGMRFRRLFFNRMVRLRLDFVSLSAAARFGYCRLTARSRRWRAVWRDPGSCQPVQQPLRHIRRRGLAAGAQGDLRDKQRVDLRHSGRLAARHHPRSAGAWGREVQSFGGFTRHHHDRTWCETHDSFSYAADEHVLQPGAAVGSHDNEVRMPVAGRVDNRL